jgi:hypothetical protein
MSLRRLPPVSASSKNELTILEILFLPTNNSGLVVTPAVSSTTAWRSFSFAVADPRKPKAVSRERKAASSRSTTHLHQKIYRKNFFLGV